MIFQPYPHYTQPLQPSITHPNPPTSQKPRTPRPGTTHLSQTMPVHQQHSGPVPTPRQASPTPGQRARSFVTTPRRKNVPPQDMTSQRVQGVVPVARNRNMENHTDYRRNAPPNHEYNSPQEYGDGERKMSAGKRKRNEVRGL